MVLVISCLVALAASVNADGLGLGGSLVYAPGHASVDYYTYPKYAFEYSVNDPHTGDNKAQWEKRDGDVVKGAYSLVEPDGSVRVVEYWADKSGFNAVVKRIGSKLHPVTDPASIYKAPIPLLGHGSAVAPLTVGPVAKLGHLATAPLISGPIVAGPISTANLLKTNVPLEPIAPIHTPIIKTPIAPIGSIGPIIPIAKPIAPILPISKPITPVLPIIKQAPYADGGLLGAGIHGPIYKSGSLYSDFSGPIFKSNLHGPILKSEHEYPILPGPILKAGPAYSDLPSTIIKSGPVYSDLPSSILKSESVYPDFFSPHPKTEPVYPNLPGPIFKSGPVYPYMPSPILKSEPAYSDLPGPILKSGPILSGYLGHPIAPALPLSKVPSRLEDGYLKGPIHGPEILNPWTKVIKV